MSTDPYEGMDPEVVARAREAKCSRCGVTVVDAPSARGTVLVNYYVPALGVRQRVYLCGEHGLEFREFLYPSLATSEEFQSAKALLQEHFARHGE